MLALRIVYKIKNLDYVSKRLRKVVGWYRKLGEPRFDPVLCNIGTIKKNGSSFFIKVILTHFHKK